MKPEFDTPPSEHKGDKTFLCQNVRGDHYESTLDTSNYFMNSAVLRPSNVCSAASLQTHGSTAACTGASTAWSLPFWAQEPNPDQVNRDQSKCARGAPASVGGGQYYQA